MGLIKAALGAVGGTVSDQWLEYFYCDAIPADTLVVKGQKRTSSRSGNSGSDNIISNGSVIAVADGQCMIIVEQGKVVDLCAEPGEYTYDLSTEPSVFVGDLRQSIFASLETMGKRFAFGGEPPKDQRVYYFNTKELLGNKYGTPQPVPFRVIDERAGIDMDVRVTCFGEYSYRICDPVLFYTNICGNVAQAYKREEIDGQLKSELLTALQPAFGKMSETGIRYSQLPAHTMELADALNDVLSPKWRNLRGVEIVSCGVSSVKALDEDEADIKEMQKAATYMDPAARAGYEAVTKAQALKDAAKNEGGMGGFIAMNMAQTMAGPASAAGREPMPVGQPVSSGIAQPAAADPKAWTCACGSVNTGNFCPQCGASKPADPGEWVCACGSKNTGNFCPQCGARRPVVKTACEQCGYQPDDLSNPPKFCPQCGTAF